jgi:hypothetical protein
VGRNRATSEPERDVKRRLLEAALEVALTGATAALRAAALLIEKR